MRGRYGNNRRNKEGTREEEGRKEGQDKPFRLVPLTRFQMEA